MGDAKLKLKWMTILDGLVLNFFLWIYRETQKGGGLE